MLDKEEEKPEALVNAAQDDLPKKKNNTCLAVIAINICAISLTVMSLLYKIVAVDGVSIVEFTFFRSVSAGIIACIWNATVCMNPFKQFPSDWKWTLFIRVVAGHTGFALFNLAVPLAPLSLIIILFNTSPFWISIIGCLFLKENLMCLEAIAMVICFGAVVVIAL